MFFGNRMRISFRIVDDRDRGTPVALARDEPVTETILNDTTALILIFQPCGNSFTGLSGMQARELIRIIKNTVLCITLLKCQDGIYIAFIGRINCGFPRYAVFLCENEVALIMGITEYSAFPVVCKNKIRDPDGNALSISGIDCIGSRKDSCFFFS